MWKELLSFLADWFDRRKEEKAKELAPPPVDPLERLEELASLIQKHFVPFNIVQYLNSYPDVRYRIKGNGITIQHAENHIQQINTLLEELPGVSIEKLERTSEYGDMLAALRKEYAVYTMGSYQPSFATQKIRGTVKITFDRETYLSTFLLSNHVLYDTFWNLRSLIAFLHETKREEFKSILMKYEDTFQILLDTTNELLQEGCVTDATKLHMKKTLDAIIEEFLSLKILLDKRKLLDKEALQKSLEQRIEDELTLVSRIKSNW